MTNTHPHQSPTATYGLRRFSAALGPRGGATLGPAPLRPRSRLLSLPLLPSLPFFPHLRLPSLSLPLLSLPLRLPRLSLPLSRPLSLPLSLLSLSLLLPISPSLASNAVTPPTDEVRFDQRLDNQVPLDVEFRDETGAVVRLEDLIGERPVLLSLVYYECPMLCTLVLNGKVEAMGRIPYKVGQEYDAITLSFDPSETHVLAARKKDAYTGVLDQEKAADGWHFLVGEKEQIDQICDAVGFSYKYVEETGEYAHRSGIVLLTPGGKVSRYFPGIEYEPRDLRLGLVEASAGKIGTLSDRLSLLCFHYDPAVGTYGFVIMNVLRLACFATVGVLAVALAVFLRREHRRPAPAAT